VKRPETFYPIFAFAKPARYREFSRYRFGAENIARTGARPVQRQRVGAQTLKIL
jgi:hypothetical protein